MFLPPDARYIIDKLTVAGYDAYAVGGAVRDSIMNKSPTDFDITTNAPPEETKRIFSDCKIIETGIKHGTVTVMIDDEPFEVTTFRTEEGYSDGRHPDKVSFTSDITDDLSRRDFTVNSIAYNPYKGYVDPFGGISDTERKTIRCVGTPKVRFEEDSLRILRALRFASSLSFTIDADTKEAMFDCKHLLKNISMERIYTEITKLLCGKNIKNILIEYVDIIAEIIPEISTMKNFNQHNFHHKYNLLEHTAVVTENVEPVPHMRLAAFLHDIAKPLCMTFDADGVGHFYGHPSKGAETADKILSRLRCDNRTKEKVVKLIKIHDTPVDESDRIIKKKLRTIGEDMLIDLISLQQADTLGLADEYRSRIAHFEKLRQLIADVKEQQECFSVKDLAVNGYDLLAIGLEGRSIGKALDILLDAVIDEKIQNTKQSLIRYIESNAGNLI